MKSTLDIIIQAQNRASKEFKSLRRDLDALNSAGGNIVDIGSQFLVAGGAIATGLGMAINEAKNFEHSVIGVASVMEGGMKNYDAIAESARHYGKTTIMTATESADAMKLVAQYGYDVSDAHKIMGDTILLATGQQYDLAMATDIVISTLKNFEKQGYNTQQIGDILAKSSNISSASMEKFRYSMKYVSPVANSLGISLEDMVAQLSLLYDAGLPAETAGTALRMAYSRLLSPTKNATEALQKYGIGLDEVNPKTNKMADIMDNLKKSGVETQDMFKIFGVEAAPALIAMMDRGGDALRGYESKLKDAGGTMEDMYKVQMNSLTNQSKILQSQLQELAIAIGSALLPYVKKAVAILQKAVTWFNNLSEGQKKAIAISLAVSAGLLLLLGTITVLVGGLIIFLATWKEFFSLMKGIGKIAKASKTFGLLAKGLKALRTAFTVARTAVMLFSTALLTNPITWIVLGIIAVIALLYIAWKKNWGGIQEKTQAVWDWIVGAYNSIVDGTMNFVNSAMDWIKAFDLKATLMTAWAGIVEWVSGLWQSLKDTIFNFLHGILMDTGQSSEEARTTLETAWNNIKTAITNILDTLYWVFIGRWIAIGQVIWQKAQEIWTWLVSIFTAIKDWFMPYWNTLVTFITGIWNTIKTGFVNWLTGIWQEFMWKWALIKAVLITVWNVIKSFLAQRLENVKQNISNVWNVVKAIFISVWGGIKAYFQSIWESIKSIGQSAMNIIKNIIALAINLIAGNWEDAWDNVCNIVDEYMNIAKEFVTGGLEAVIKAIKGFFSTAENSGSALMEAFAKGITNAVGKVKGAVEDVLGKARRFFGFSDAKEGPFSNITHSGYATIHAFAKGVQSSKNMLSRAVGGTLQSGISGASVGNLGINAMGNGFMARKAPVQQDNPAPISITINNYSDKVSPEDIAQQVMRELDRQLRR
jgi:TP901 family phage tail tape measure protein